MVFHLNRVHETSQAFSTTPSVAGIEQQEPHQVQAGRCSLADPGRWRAPLEANKWVTSEQVALQNAQVKT